MHEGHPKGDERTEGRTHHLMLESLPHLREVFHRPSHDHQSTILRTVGQDIEQTLDGFDVWFEWGLVRVRPGSCVVVDLSFG